jgi:hypothetical protein
LVNAAILAAADAAPNVIGVIDWRGEDWLTGTGSVSNPKGDGNQDIYIGDAAGTDTIHANYQGQKYLGGRLVERVGPMPLSDVATIGDLDFRVPLPPASGSYRLQSVDGTPQWVAL